MELKNGLTEAEKILHKKINLHSWIASVIAMLGVLTTVFLFYGKAISAVDIFALEQKTMKTKDAELETKLDRVIRNQDVMYFNLLQMAKKMNYVLSKEEEIFLNNYGKSK